MGQILLMGKLRQGDICVECIALYYCEFTLAFAYN